MSKKVKMVDGVLAKEKGPKGLPCFLGIKPHLIFKSKETAFHRRDDISWEDFVDKCRIFVDNFNNFYLQDAHKPDSCDTLYLLELFL